MAQSSPTTRDPSADETQVESTADTGRAPSPPRPYARSVRLGQPSVPESGEHIVQPGDTLWDITETAFGNPWEWPRVWSYNPEIANPHLIYPNDRVRLVPGGITTVEGTAPRPSADRRSVGPRTPAPTAIYLREEAFLDADALQAAGVVAGSPEGQMLLTFQDAVYVDFSARGPGASAEVRPGQELSVFHALEESERGRDESGTLVRIFGALRVDSYDPETRVGRCTVIEAIDPIERGFLVADVPRRFDSVSVVRNSVSVDARIVASIRPRVLLGEHQVVFLDAGSDQGVVAGNRFVVTSSGDAWRTTIENGSLDPGSALPAPPLPARLPPETIAEIRVVHVRPRSCTAIVTNAVHEIAIGDAAHMREGY